MAVLPLDDTIAAVASPPGGAARGILRVSGADVPACLKDVFCPSGPSLPSKLADPVVLDGSLQPDGVAAPLPCELYLWPKRRSYTGDAVAEIHTLGSPPLLQAALQTLLSAGVRLAEPGEFTLRAFLAGRIDLTRAEAVLGVIDAGDPDELDVALAQLAGGLAEPLHALRDGLLDLLAQLEAGFDFADEDLPFISPEELDRQLGQAAEDVDRLARQMASRGETSELVRVVLAGEPNVGKSSLFNALVRRTGALVSDTPGTTRDYLTAELNLDGARCQLVDTAGTSDDPVSEPAETIRAAAREASLEQARRADVCVLCVDATLCREARGSRGVAGAKRSGAPEPDSDWGTATLCHQPPDRQRRIVVLTKVDIAASTDFPSVALPTSSLTGRGIHALREELRRAVLSVGASSSGAVAATAARCGESVRRATESLRRARDLVDRRGGEELVAAEVRVALDELGKVAGAVYTDDVLDRIFSRFCIGK